MSKKKHIFEFIMGIIYLIVCGIVPIIWGPIMYFGTGEPLFLVLPLIGVAAIMIAIVKLKRSKRKMKDS
ncbi:hypothetical protein ACFQ4Z_07975 [Oceanobacillus oncorhynchi subsp. oncorhynchi]|uniref:hypothetical protein n=1 Tax=Oceanobacillus oncorhynchi TaxID=545501 RepID=UPI0031DBC7CE